MPNEVRNQTEMPPWVIPLLIGIAIPAATFFFGSIVLLILWLVIGSPPSAS